MSKIANDSPLRTWLAIMGVSTLMIGASYAMAQQATRLNADDAPLSAAQTAKQELQSGSSAKDVVPSLKTNLREDVSTFVIVTDNSQHVLAGSAVLDNKTPLPPKGVFDFTSIHGSDHFTWEPSPGVRIATRVIKYGSSPNNGFIIAGQSLQPYEERISTYTWIALAAWLASLAWSYLLILLPRLRSS